MGLELKAPPAGTPRSDRSPGSPLSRRSRAWLAAAVVVAGAFYQPVAFWARNAWDLSSPVKILIVGGILALVGIALQRAMARLGIDSLLAALATGGCLVLFANWAHFRGAGWPLVALVVVIATILHRRGSRTLVDWLGLWFIAAFAFIPILQLTMAHLEGSSPYPILERTEVIPAKASGLVEDVVFVIVDAYPNLHIAEEWFGHETDRLVDNLERRGFVVADSAWSRHTFTSLSVASMLELKSVVDDRPTEHWGNRSSLWAILRGDNFVANTLKTAGFRYIHVESNWAGSSCGPNVDRCIASPWIDEQVWRMFGSTVAESWAADRHYAYTGTLHTAAELTAALDEIGGNGTHDFLFAHLLMPHEPVLVDKDCRATGAFRSIEPDDPSRIGGIEGQMSCVDLLVSNVLGHLPPESAVLLTGDHGSGTGGQVGAEPEQWSDQDIAERFGVFLSYRVPNGCADPRIPDPVTAMGALLSCALSGEYEAPEPRYLIGDQDPVYVEPTRMGRIKEQVARGLLGPESS